MKLILILICGLGLLSSVAESSYAQTTKITFSFEDATIKDVLLHIEQHSEFSFMYDNNKVDVTRKVNIDVQDETISTILAKLFKEEQVNYQTIGKHIVIFDRQTTPEINLAQQQQQQQQPAVSGTVTDDTGQPLPGVTVVVKGTTQGTVTNADGEYSISNIPEDATLQFSFVGMKTQEVVVGDQTIINVSMEEETIGLQEVVAIGYGTQKRINLTGAVDQIAEEQIEGRHRKNVTQILQGVIPNVNIKPMDGKPTAAPSINIRGIGSIGQEGEALILIDGVEGDPSMLNPNDIESVSVLKDAASAAIYGARGVFGVVLITTKKPQVAGVTVEYSLSVGKQAQIEPPKTDSDGYRYAKMFNEAYFNRNGTYPNQINKTQSFSQEYLAELKRRSEDPSLPKTDLDDEGRYVYYHSTDWYKLLYKDQWDVNTQEHNLNVSGGSETAKFMVSGRYSGFDGLYRYSSDIYNMYNLRAKGSLDVTKWLQIESNFDYSARDYFYPLNTAENNFTIPLNLAAEGHPTSTMFNPDGTLTYSSAYSVGDNYLGYNGTYFDRFFLRNTTGFNTNFFDNTLRVIGNFSFQKTVVEEKRIQQPVPYSIAPGEISYAASHKDDIRQTTNVTDFLATNIYSEYENIFMEVHYVKAMVGLNYEQSTWEQKLFEKNQLLFPTALNVNLAIGDNVLATGDYNRWRIFGGFFRLNYIFDDRYLIEFNGRYDGSSKFPTDEMYAFFPSLSAAWRISEENFWPVSQEIISVFKIRGSYGSLGNANIGPYMFQQQFSIGTGILLDGSIPTTTGMPQVIPDELSWETSTTRNIGVDLSLFDNKLEFIGDAYTRVTTDMYTIGKTLPATFGTTSPKGNYADMETRGWEMTLGWRDRFQLAKKTLNYNIRFTLSDWDAEITRYNNPDKFLNDYYEGMKIGEVWGYVCNGFFTSDEDVANHADQMSRFPPRVGGYQPGDMKFEDLNGDGVINEGENTVNDPGDRMIIGNTNSSYYFGLNLSAEWNNIIFSAFFQGIGKQDWYPHQNTHLFWGQYNRPYHYIPKWHLEDGIIWSEENPDTFFGRYVARGSQGGLQRQTNTKYLMNGAYIRLRNVQLGYDLPHNLFSRVGMSSARISISGEGLWTWSPLYKWLDGVDVENMLMPSEQLNRSPGSNSGDGYNYPNLKSIILSLNVKF